MNKISKITEKFKSDDIYETGTVVVFGGANEISQSQTVNDTRVAGVVISNELYDHEIITVGRALCKVVGRVKKGDLLTTSNTKGHAVKALDPKIGSIIGKSLVDKLSGESEIIEISVG